MPDGLSLENGIALRLYADCDSAYEPDLFEEHMLTLDVKKPGTLGYNHRTIGRTEKGVEVIKNYLAFNVNYSDKEWDLWCREATFTYNSNAHFSTGYSPIKAHVSSR